MGVEKEAYDRAVRILELCKTNHGFYAAYPGYDAVWARDSMIISLGASLLGDKFKTTFRKSIETLGDHQSANGQIPNAVDKYEKRRPHVDFKSIDSTLWFLIGHQVYKRRYGEPSLFRKHKKKIEKAFVWLRCQDVGENGLLTQLPTSDWQDAFPHRYGATINTMSLWYYVLKLYGDRKEMRRVYDVVNDNEEDGLWEDGEYYLPWRWKNHNKYLEMGRWFDSLGNVLAVLFGLANEYKAGKIFKHIDKNKVAQPYPMKAIYPPIKRGSKDWKPYFLDAGARNPYCYLNGGIWPYIGGFYVLSLLKQGKLKDAKNHLRKFAEANMKRDGNYSEWLHGKTGKASEGGGQGWNAGMYVLSYKSLEKGSVLLPSIK